MKYIRQFFIILFISFLGEIVHALLPLPVPASIYGLVIMLLALKSGVVKLSSVDGAGRFLIEIMPLTFIPAAAGIINSWEVLRPVIIPMIIITVISTIAVMGVSGRVTQAFIKRGEKCSSDLKNTDAEQISAGGDIK